VKCTMNNQAMLKRIWESREDDRRYSNFELFRILLMLAIVAHHYVVNSGFHSLYDFNHITGNMIFLQLFGFAGKIGINCFVFITGYFMIKSQFKFQKLLKLYLEIKFYRWLIYVILVITGYEAFSFSKLFRTVLILFTELIRVLQ